MNATDKSGRDGQTKREVNFKKPAKAVQNAKTKTRLFFKFGKRQRKTPYLTRRRLEVRNNMYKFYIK